MWDDPSLEVPSDPPRRALYRRLQSWWREHHLGVAPGHSGGRLVGSSLPAHVADTLPNLNFLTEEVRHYVRRRVPQIQAEDGTIDVARLRANLLSSQPLCFNVFGHLQAHPVAAAAVLGRVFGVRIDEIVRSEVEWAPPKSLHLGDRTAFDAFVDYTADGERRFLGVEVKYTEPFSTKQYDSSRYRTLTEQSGAFRPGAADRLVGSATNQLWRQLLLTLSLAATPDYAGGRAAVLALADDPGVAKGMAGLAAELTSPGDMPLVATLQGLVDGALAVPELAGWAAAVKTRYVDLTPVLQ